jgi:hypothetical protein
VAAEYHINREDEFVALCCDGEIDLVEIREMCQRLLKDPEFNPSWPQLADLRGLELKLTHGTMRQFLNYTAATYRPRISAPIAVVLDGSKDDAFCAGVFRFVCGLADAEVFDDYALAIKWLLKNGWPNSADLPQPQDAGRNYADAQPKQIRA